MMGVTHQIKWRLNIVGVSQGAPMTLKMHESKGKELEIHTIFSLWLVQQSTIHPDEAKDMAKTANTSIPTSSSTERSIKP